MPKKPGQSVALPVVLEDIVQRLLNDDWARLSNEDGSDAYYIIGAESWLKEMEDSKTYDLEFRAPKQPSELGKYLTRSQVAAATSGDEHVRLAGQRLEATGVDLEKVLEFLRSSTSGVEPLSDAPLSDESVSAFADYLEAVIAARVVKGEMSLDADLRQQASLACEKLYLHELAQRYKKIVKRAATLDHLDFADPRLEEASRAYLYGFYRAAIVLAATSLESHLKRMLRVTEVRSYRSLAEGAWKAGFLGQDRALIEAAAAVFVERNNVVHKEGTPKKDDAQRTLDLARSVVAHLADH